MTIIIYTHLENTAKIHVLTNNHLKTNFPIQTTLSESYSVGSENLMKWVRVILGLDKIIYSYLNNEIL